jgi:exodeoxyribonuclease III
MSWRITTWNVNGLRAVLNKNGFDWLPALSPDILCLQEIKAHPHQIMDDQLKVFDGYQADWNPAQRPGYSGVLTLARKPASETRTGLVNERFNEEGRVVVSRYPDFYLYNIYFPNGQRDHGRLTYKLDFYASLLEECDALHARGETVIICGDFNTAHNEIDLRNPKQNQNTSGFLPEERAWLDHYLEHGFVDVYRELYPERVQYTWWMYRLNARQRNIGWRLDFFMVSQKMMARVKDVIIHEAILGSDHCPVTIEFE